MTLGEKKRKILGSELGGVENYHSLKSDELRETYEKETSTYNLVPPILLPKGPLSPK